MPRQISGAIRFPIFSSRSKKARDQQESDQSPEDRRDGEDRAVGAALVAHQVVWQAEVAHGGGDGHDPQAELVEAMPVGKDQPREGDLRPEVDPQPGELDGVGGERRAQDALLGRVAGRTLTPRHV
jgi:hypothetical protein